jgi:mRNA interferase MazF
MCASGIVWTLMITSARHESWPGDVPVSDLTLAGLPRGCVVRTRKIATLDVRHATRLGLLAIPDRTAVAAALRGVLHEAFAS